MNINILDFASFVYFHVVTAGKYLLPLLCPPVYQWVLLDQVHQDHRERQENLLDRCHLYHPEHNKVSSLFFNALLKTVTRLTNVLNSINLVSVWGFVEKKN